MAYRSKSKASRSTKRAARAKPRRANKKAPSRSWRGSGVRKISAKSGHVSQSGGRTTKSAGVRSYNARGLNEDSKYIWADSPESYAPVRNIYVSDFEDDSPYERIEDAYYEMYNPESYIDD